jgi:integrase
VRIIHRCPKCRKFLPANKTCCVKEKTYWIEYRMNGKLKRERIGRDLKIAKIVLADRERSILLNKYVGQKSETSFEALKDWYLDLPEVRSLITFNQSKNILNKFAKLIPSINGNIRDEVSKYINSRYSVSSSTKNRDISALKSLFSAAVNYEKIDRNPIAAIKLLEVNNERVSYLSDGDIDCLLRRADKKIKDVIHFASLHLMRWNEIMAMEWADIRDGEITVRTKKRGSSKVRQCPLDPEGWNLIKSYPSRFKNGRVFEQVPYSTFNRLFEKAKGDLTDITFHDLRHYAADRMRSKGYETADIMRWAGWKSMSIFHRYTTSKVVGG